MEFGARLRELREEKKLTQAALAEHLGISRRTVGCYEAGTAFPRDSKKVQEICTYFDVSADYLFALTTLKNYRSLAEFILLYGEISLGDRETINSFISFLHTRQKASDTASQP